MRKELLFEEDFDAQTLATSIWISSASCTCGTHRAKRKKQNFNLNLLAPTDVEGIEDLPVVQSYTGSIPASFIPFDERNKWEYGSGIHCFAEDFKINSTFSCAERVCRSLHEYVCVVAPDFTLYVDAPRALNVYSLYKNRWVTSYWQRNGVRTIPSASWAGVDSFNYCFDGLPEGGIIAVGHVAIGRDRHEKELYKTGVEELVKRKHPDVLLVYGLPLDFNPDVKVTYIKSRLSMMRDRNKKKSVGQHYPTLAGIED